MLSKKKRWTISEPDNDKCALISASLGLPLPLARALVIRGITDPDSATSFLNAPLKEIHDPFLMKGMRQGVDRVALAIKNKESVWVFADYDVDGITAASLMVHFFREIDAPINAYIPSRLSEGYGLNEEAMNALKKKGAELIITADCGIGSVKEVERANELGIDVIVTDHHQVLEELPDAYAVLNPTQADCAYPYKSLSGAGIIYKFLIGLRAELRETGSLKKEPNLKRHLDLVALATIADMVPLTGENHILARHGLYELTNTLKPGLKALKSVSNVTEKKIGTYEVGFLLGPRLNAAGRMGDAERGLNLLCSTGMNEAVKLASELDLENHERQRRQKEVVAEARRMVKKSVNLDTELVIVLASDKWHQGVVGIAASRIVDIFHRPTILIALEDGVGKGSARSIDPFNIFRGLSECSFLLDGFGGHKKAAGLTIEEGKIPGLRNKLNQVAAEALTPKDLIPSVSVDGELDLEELDFDLVRQLELMAPFGMSNPRPVFKASGVRPSGDIKRMGEGGEHVKFPVKGKGGVNMEAVGFFMGSLFKDADAKSLCLDILFTPNINEWRGREILQVRLVDVRSGNE